MARASLTQEWEPAGQLLGIFWLFQLTIKTHFGSLAMFDCDIPIGLKSIALGIWLYENKGPKIWYEYHAS